MVCHYHDAAREAAPQACLQAVPFILSAATDASMAPHEETWKATCKIRGACSSMIISLTQQASGSLHSVPYNIAQWSSCASLLVTGCALL